MILCCLSHIIFTSILISFHFIWSIHLSFYSSILIFSLILIIFSFSLFSSSFFFIIIFSFLTMMGGVWFVVQIIFWNPIFPLQIFRAGSESEPCRITHSQYLFSTTFWQIKKKANQVQDWLMHIDYFCLCFFVLLRSLFINAESLFILQAFIISEHFDSSWLSCWCCWCPRPLWPRLLLPLPLPLLLWKLGIFPTS